MKHHFYHRDFTLPEIERGEAQKWIKQIKAEFGSVGCVLHRRAFTNRRDKNRADIYEGDIIKTGFFWVVYFGENQDVKGTIGWCIKNLSTLKTYPADDATFRLCEVTDHIYGHPGLLRELPKYYPITQK